jgi:hypothetical protein
MVSQHRGWTQEEGAIPVPAGVNQAGEFSAGSPTGESHPRIAAPDAPVSRATGHLTANTGEPDRQPPGSRNPAPAGPERPKPRPIARTGLRELSLAVVLSTANLCSLAKT